MTSVEIPLSLPEPMLEHIRNDAARKDRSLSWCVQKAWAAASAELRALEPALSHPLAEETYRARYAEGGTRRRTFFFPKGMAAEITAESQRQARSPSWLLQRAWCLASAR
jgi:uncharacterized small protein (TIGR04563 family)